MKKEAIRQANTVKKEFLSNLFLVKKERRTKASFKSETTKCIYTIQSLENGRIAEPRCLLQKRDYLSKFHLKMHIVVFLYRKTRGNTFGTAGKETCTNFCAYFLTLDLPHEFSQNYLESQMQFCFSQI